MTTSELVAVSATTYTWPIRSEVVPAVGPRLPLGPLALAPPGRLALELPPIGLLLLIVLRLVLFRPKLPEPLPIELRPLVPLLPKRPLVLPVPGRLAEDVLGL